MRHLFDVGRHKTIATLRSDGSPRILGIECEFRDGELRFASMSDARKLADLNRDPRFALHGPTVHPEEAKEGDWPGEAKISGRAMPIDSSSTSDDVPRDETAFTADIVDVVITRLHADASKRVVEWWTLEHGVRTCERQ